MKKDHKWNRDKLTQYVTDVLDYIEGTSQWDEFTRWMHDERDYSDADVDSAHQALRHEAGRS